VLSGKREILALCIIVFLFSIQSAEAEPSRIIDAGEILKKIEQGQPVEYNDVIVKGDLDLSRRGNMESSAGRVSINSPIQIANSVILGDVTIKKVVLEDAVDFNKTKFMSRTSITDSWFNDTASFNKASFEDVADFSTTRFNGPAVFSYARFGQTAYFRDSAFVQDAKFISAQFSQQAYFQRARFSKDANFKSTKFDRGAIFKEAAFRQNADFKLAQFLQAVDFDSVRFQQAAGFDRANFIQDANFDHAQFSQTANFGSANFHQESYFRNTSIQNALFQDIRFKEDATFDNVRIENLSLKGSDVEKLDIRWSSIHNLAYDDSAYVLLRKNLDMRGYLDDAGECEFSYRCERRAYLWEHDFGRWLFDFLAFATYGYGLRPVWPLGWSMAFILVGGLFFFLTNSVVRSRQLSDQREISGNRIARKAEGKVSIWESLLLATTYFTSGASNIISATPSEFVPVGLGRYAVVLLRLLGWIFFVIFLSSLTRTV
jgi:uncharacterized protein YjbI with pentapeptide repeats